MSKEKQTFDLSTIDPLSLSELKNWEEKQHEIVKENPFVEIADTETYNEAKKRRTALVSARTSIEKQDKLVASKLKEFRSKVSEASGKLIEITLPHEQKQQEEVKKYEAEKDREREEKAEKERQRVQAIKDNIEKHFIALEAITESMVFETIEESDQKFRDYLDSINRDDFDEFVELLDEKLNSEVSVFGREKERLTNEENQRLENERLKKEAEENARKAHEAEKKLAKEREEMRLKKEEEDRIFSEEQAKIEADKKKLEEEKEVIRKKEEAENKMKVRTQILMDKEGLGLKFNFNDAFISEDGSINVSVDDLKFKSDEEFDLMVRKCLDFKNCPQIEEKTPQQVHGEEKEEEGIEAINNIEVNDAEEVDFKEPWDAQIDHIIDSAFSKVNREGVGFLNSEMLRCKTEIKNLFKEYSL